MYTCSGKSYDIEIPTTVALLVTKILVRALRIKMMISEIGYQELAQVFSCKAQAVGCKSRCTGILVTSRDTKASELEL